MNYANVVRNFSDIADTILIDPDLLKEFRQSYLWNRLVEIKCGEILIFHNSFQFEKSPKNFRPHKSESCTFVGFS